MQIELANVYKTRSTGERKQVMVEIGKLKLEIGALVFDLDKVDSVRYDLAKLNWRHVGRLASADNVFPF